MDISVIIPVYNEEENIELLFNRLSAVCASLTDSYELIFVNDGSRDASIDKIKDLAKKHEQVRFLHLSRNFGHQIAVTAGLDYSRGDAVVIIDADLQDPPELIAEMIAKMEDGYDVVYAKRKQRKGESIFKKWTAKLFYRILSKITNVHIPVDTGDFRVVSRTIVDLLKEMPEQNKFLRGQISWLGFNQTYIEYDRQERHAGETGYPIKKMLRFAMDGITGFSDFPLKIVSFFGFLVSFIAFIVIIYSLISWLVLENTVQGWTSLMISILFIGGIQMIAIGIIGEYLSRINQNIRNRPLYIVQEKDVEKEKG